MTQQTVGAVGIIITVQDNGYYLLDFWHRMMGQASAEHVLYSDLTWSELGDVVNSSLVYCRPGWSIGGGWGQPPLFP